LRVLEWIGAHQNDEAVTFGVDVEVEPAARKNVRIYVGSHDTSERDSRLMALDASKQGFSRQASHGPDVKACAAQPSLTVDRSGRRVRVRRLDRLDRLWRQQQRSVFLTEALAVRLDLACSIRGGSQVGQRREEGARRHMNYDDADEDRNPRRTQSVQLNLSR
jgi:hypothetical protein